MTARRTEGGNAAKDFQSMFSGRIVLSWRKILFFFPSRLGRPQRFETRAHFTDEQVRLFPGGEVCALGEPVVMDQLWIGFLCPTLRRLVNLLCESAHGDRNLDAPHIEEAARRQIVRCVPVETRRRDRSI